MSKIQFQYVQLISRRHNQGYRLSILAILIVVWLSLMGCIATSAIENNNMPIGPEPTHEPQNEASINPTPTALVIGWPLPLEKDQILQGAQAGYLQNSEFVDIAVGTYNPDYPDCGYPYISGIPDDGNPYILELTYVTPLLPAEIHLFTNLDPSEIKRIEILNSISGLGDLVSENGSNISIDAITVGACSSRFSIPLDIDFEVDTIFIELNNPADAGNIASVEMVGSIKNYWDAPVYWRVPIPATPVDIAMGTNGMVYVATEPNGLFAYDVEGNFLREFDVPEQSEISAIASDPFGNLLVMDNAYQWFIMLSPQGEQLTIGGDAAYDWIGVNPITGNLYLMADHEVSVYTTDTAELISQLMLADMSDYAGLSFDAAGNLFTFADVNWEPKLVQLDPNTMQEIYSQPLRISNQMELTAQDLAIDENGNKYILFSINCAQIAVHQLDVNGNLVKRFGHLTPAPDETIDVSFLDPKAIAVSPDGRFVIIADGYDDQAYLTAYLMEIE